MVGIGVELVDRGVLHDLAAVHDQHPVDQAGNHPEVVGDPDDRHAQLGPEVLHQFENLGLDGDVQGRRGLIGHQDPRITGQGDGDHHPLTHPSRQLVRIAAQPVLGRWDAHKLQQLEGPGPHLGPAGRLVDDEGLRDLVTHGDHRIQ